MTTRFYYFFLSPSLRPIKLSFQMPSHSVTPSPLWPPPKRGKNVLWMLNQEYEDPYTVKGSQGLLFHLASETVTALLLANPHSQGFRSASLDMHSIALNFGACSSKVMIYSEWKIKRGGGMKRSPEAFEERRHNSHFSLHLSRWVASSSIGRMLYFIFYFFLHTLRVVWWLLTLCQRNVLRCCRTDREACQSRANFASELQWKNNNKKKRTK